MDNPDALASSFWPDLETIALPAREKRRLAPETRTRIIVALCTMAPLSVKELSELLDRNEAYVGDAIRPLINAGALSFLYPDQPRHPKQKYVAAASAALTATKPQAAATPEPRPIPPVIPARPVPSPAPELRSAPDAPKPVQAEPELQRRNRGPTPNGWTNLAVALVGGVGLSWLSVPLWPILGLVVSVALAWLHIRTNSPQYQRYRTLHPHHRARRRLSFIVLKASVAFAEITVVLLLARVFHG